MNFNKNSKTNCNPPTFMRHVTVKMFTKFHDTSVNLKPVRWFLVISV